MGRTLALQHHGIEASRLVLGCMGLGGGWDRESVTEEHVKQAHEAVEAALAAGITMFDHADIYTLGKAEVVFGRVLKERPQLREGIILQSKCGIRFEEGPGVQGGTISPWSIFSPRWTAFCSGWARSIWISCCCTAPIR